MVVVSVSTIRRFFVVIVVVALGERLFSYRGPPFGTLMAEVADEEVTTGQDGTGPATDETIASAGEHGAEVAAEGSGETDEAGAGADTAVAKASNGDEACAGGEAGEVPESEGPPGEEVVTEDAGEVGPDGEENVVIPAGEEGNERPEDAAVDGDGYPELALEEDHRGVLDSSCSGGGEGSQMKSLAQAREPPTAFQRLFLVEGNRTNTTSRKREALSTGHDFPRRFDRQGCHGGERV